MTKPKEHYNLPNWISAKNKKGRWVKGCILYTVGSQSWLYNRENNKAPGIDPKTIKYDFEKLKSYLGHE